MMQYSIPFLSSSIFVPIVSRLEARAGALLFLVLVSVTMQDPSGKIKKVPASKPKECPYLGKKSPKIIVKYSFKLGCIHHQCSWHEEWCWGKCSNDSQMESGSEELASDGEEDRMVDASEHTHSLVTVSSIICGSRTDLTRLDCFPLGLKTRQCIKMGSVSSRPHICAEDTWCAGTEPPRERPHQPSQSHVDAAAAVISSSLSWENNKCFTVCKALSLTLSYPILTTLRRKADIIVTPF